jgi:molybdopterin molybdotransferase
LGDGKIYESNRIALAPLLKRAGAVPQAFPLVPDNLTATHEALEEALERCDGVVTTGGVSVGELDLVKSAFEQLGGKMEFWKVAMKPGKPFVFGRRREKLLFGLPGNPVSAFATFLLLVHSAVLRWQGATNVALPTHQGVLAEPLINRGDRRHFMRIRIDEQGKVHSAGIQASHVLSSLARANGLVDVPPYTTLEAGTMAQVIQWAD